MKTKSLIVILHYNTVEYTDTIYNILKPYENDDYDLLVFDNGSDPDKISKYTTHKIEENCYFGGGYDLVMNYMLEHTEYDSMMMMSSDIICHGKGFIKNLRRELFSQKDLMVISPSITEPSLNQCFWPTMHCWGAKEIRMVPWVDFQCPVLKREFVEKVQGFGIKYGWGNDVMTGIICEENNWKIGVCDYISAIHLGNATVKVHKNHPIISKYNQLAEQEMVIYFQNKGLYPKLIDMRTLAKNYKYNG